jgi:hypothetical protein
MKEHKEGKTIGYASSVRFVVFVVTLPTTDFLCNARALTRFVKIFKKNCSNVKSCRRNWIR